MSTVTQLFTDFQSHGFNDFVIADFISLLNHSYMQFNTREPWPFLEKSVIANMTISSANQFSTTTDIKQVLSVINLTQGYELAPERSDSIYKKYTNNLTTPGQPVYYHLPIVNAAVPNGRQIHFYPNPIAADSCQMRYIYIPALFTAGTDVPVIPERFHRILLFGALWQAYRQEDDSGSGNDFETMFEEGIQSARQDLWDAQYDRPDYVVNIMDDYSFTYY